MNLRCHSPSLPLGCDRVYVRVDWNIPLGQGLGVEDSLKLTRSYPLLRDLRKAGAITFVLTHLGRPKKRDAKFSTKPLAKIVSAHSGMLVQYLDCDLGSAKGREKFARDIDRFDPGDVVLLENVRFQKGEDTCAAPLVKAYAEHADAFINDAFASSHRRHASVTGLAKALPSFAGPSLCAEAAALSTVVKDGKKYRPYLAVIGGAKLTTKIPVLKSLLATADKVLVGGAMAHAFLAAKRLPIGKSYIEKGSIASAQALINHRKLVLPTDVVVGGRKGHRPRAVDIRHVAKWDSIMDIGPETMRAWAAEIKKARMVVWNGPLGLTEMPAFAHGSLVIGRAIASRSKGKAFGVAGGGDTLPVLAQTGMQEWFDWVSTGGGAMMEFLALKGKLPGITVLQGKQALRLPELPKGEHRHEVGISCAPDAGRIATIRTPMRRVR
jgi:phosphoglycerate kinase